MEPGNRRRVVRALEVTLGSGRPFSSFGPGVDHYPESGVAQIGLRWPRDVIADRIEERVHQMVDAGLVAEVACAGASRTVAGPRRRRSATRKSCEHLDGSDERR